MSIMVQKYGGSSVATPEKIQEIANKIVKRKHEGHKMVVVVSAMGDTTDNLLSMAAKITQAPSDREIDMLLATGEQVTIALLSMAIEALGESVISLTGSQVGIMTNTVHRKARIVEVHNERILKELGAGRIVIVAGFQGVNGNNDITTLGRGGSDTTAVALASSVGAAMCEIFTDVKGVFTADPRVVENARKLDEISYDEMLEMASLGAVVLQPRAVEYGKNHQVPIHVRSAFDEQAGTIVKEEKSLEKEIVVSGVTCDKQVAKVAILEVPDRPGIASKVFQALAADHVSVDMIIQSIKRDSVNDISFTVSEEELKKAVTAMQKLADSLGAKGVAYDMNVAKISIVGAGLGGNPQVAAKMFGSLAESEINIEMISTSEIKISCLIQERFADEAVCAVHEVFSLGNGQASSS